MAEEQFANNPATVLSGAIGSTSRPVTFSVASASGFPITPQYRILIDAELLLVTAVAGTSWTATNTEGSAAATHADGTQVRHILTAGALDAFVRQDTDGVITVPEAASAPAGNPADGLFLYIDPADDKLKVRGPAGNIMVIVPSEKKFIRRTSGHLTLNNTSWADLDTGMDLTLRAVIGDVIEVGLNGFWASEAVQGRLDVATIVSGSPVNYFSNSTGTPASLGVVGWVGLSGRADAVTGPAWLTLVSGDISSGTVTLRLRYQTDVAGAKSLLATSADPLTFGAKNLGPVTT